MQDDHSRSEFHVLGSGLLTLCEIKSVSEFAWDEAGVFHDVVMSSDSLSANILHVEYAVVASITRGATVEGPAVETILKAVNAVPKSLWGIAEFTTMANWGTNGPAAGLTLKSWQSLSFPTVPIVDTASSTASIFPAAEAGADLVNSVH